MDATLVSAMPSRPRPNRPARLTQPPVKVSQQRTEQRTDLPSPETPKTKFVASDIPVQININTPEDKDKPHSPSTPHTIQTARPTSPPPPLTPAGTEDSDTDFQSAYSQSPRDDSDVGSMEVDMDDDPTNDLVRRLSPAPPSPRNPGLSDLAVIPQPWTTRTRASSTATTVTATQGSPVVAEHDNIPPPPLPTPSAAATTKSQTKVKTTPQ